MPWQQPSETKRRTGLRLANSMAGGERTEFFPVDPEGRHVKWYGCGPTVYDASHMGHARTYVGVDILRRVMEDYFGYGITMCMNVTDVDDKIIMRAKDQGVTHEALARKWETEFWNDMRALNVKMPDVITRVTEYVPEIVAFIEKIVENGLAYESAGSVYFDTAAFKDDGKYSYGIMEPGAVNDQQRVLEGEGDLTLTSEKRNPCDFALWKAVKPGEPSWPSPWGAGRPGWHIECSAMATAILGFPLDVHSGGIDLRFPHHTNECAQTEAWCQKSQWVNYFIHTGHLHIEGAKMSKSLKNFVTIKQCLEKFSARSLRILVLIHRWDAPMNYDPSGSSLEEATAIERQITTFFANASACLRVAGGDVVVGLQDNQKWTNIDFQTEKAIIECERDVHGALTDNINTQSAMAHLQQLISVLQSYMNQTVKVCLLKKGALFVRRILSCFGVLTEDEFSFGWQEDGASKKADDIMGVVADFRQKVRALGQASANGELLRLCDHIRDEALASVGVLLEDKGQASVWRITSKEEILKERERKVAETAEKDRLKAERQAKAQKEQEELVKRLSIPPEQFFETTKPGEYLKYDETGLPTLTKDNEPLSKSQAGKLKKVLESHRVKHQAFMAKQN
ncbi:MAG: hypothetical protein KVP17_004039 [Porospora cf. gigantea B]|uniref:uncharacterized protein n=1 Tax=Porospora cf. gigantea B TaxID=2853592 RepID=UPI00357199ED|nr:MAG: hypothetical protein KVP17_004039 [Porospora cf. gigantea B]